MGRPKCAAKGGLIYHVRNRNKIKVPDTCIYTHPLRFRGGLARLERGWHPIQIDFFEFGGDEELEFRLNTEDGSPIELGRQHFGHRAAAPADAP